MQEKLKATMEQDKLIDKLLQCSEKELPTTVADNLLSFDQSFWLRMATRAEATENAQGKEKLLTMASLLMRMVDRLVKEANKSMGASARLLQDIVKQAANERGEFVVPLSAGQVQNMKKMMAANRKSLDEAFLSNVFAYMRKANEDGLDGMVIIFQRVLQLHAGFLLSDMAGPTGFGASASAKLLQSIISAEEEEWDGILRSSLSGAQAPVSSAEFFKALQQRMEKSILGLPNGSYSQRVAGEFLKEIENRAKKVAEYTELS
eukprot:jgi/Mesvir1/5480/Mv15530-RA.1